MAGREQISNGTFDNDPNAEKIRLSWDKVNRMTTDIFNKVESTTVGSDFNLSDNVGSDNLSMSGRVLVVDNSDNDINITVDSTDKKEYSILKKGTGKLTFVEGTGRNLVLVSGTGELDGLPGSKVSIVSIGLDDYLSIDNKASYNQGANTGLEQVTENGNTGYRFVGKSAGDDVERYNIGQGAIDAANITTDDGPEYPDFPRGTKSLNGVNFGQDNKDAAQFGSNILGVANQSSAYAFSTLIGSYNNAGYGYGDILIGSYNTTIPSNVNSFLVAMGHNVKVTSSRFAAGIGLALNVNARGQVAVGTSNVPWSGSEGDPKRPSFTVGIGTTNTPAGRWSPILQKDGLNVLFSGEVIADSLTEALIESEPTGKVLITKEWANNKFTSSDNPESEFVNAPKQFVDNRTEITPYYTEDFSGGLGDFTSSGDALWIQDTNNGNGDNFSVRSGIITGRQESILLNTITTTQEYTKVKFDYKTDTELDYDFFTVEVDGIIEQFTGALDWRTEYFYVKGIGEHIIKFRYWKDEATDQGLDAAWIDNFELINENPPFIFEKDTFFNDKIIAKGRLIAEDDIYSNKNFYHSGQYFKIENKNKSDNGIRAINGDTQIYLGGYNKNRNLWYLNGGIGDNSMGVYDLLGTEKFKLSFTNIEGGYEYGFMQMPDTRFNFRLGETAGQDKDVIFVVNGDGIFRGNLKLNGTLTSHGEKSNKVVLDTNTYEVDWDAYGNHDITLTENTTITEINMPCEGCSKTLTIYVKGEFDLQLPQAWIDKLSLGDYDGLNGSQIVVQSWDLGEYHVVINKLKDY